MKHLAPILFAACVALAALLITGCFPDAPPNIPGIPQRAKSNRVAAVSYPLYYFTSRLLADTDIEVEFPAEGAADPAKWQPPESAISGMQSADLVIAGGPGVPYAEWLNRVTLAKSRICNSADTLPTADFIMVADHAIVHRHGPEGEHSHPYMVPYSWMDPAIAAKQSERIANRLKTAYPDHADSIDSNLKLLGTELDQLSKQLVSAGASFGNEEEDKRAAVLTANPKLKFFTRAAGVDDVHLLWLDELPDDMVEQMDTKVADWNSANSEEEGDGEPSEMRQIILWPAKLIKPWSPGSPAVGGFDAVVIDLMDGSLVEGDYLSVMEDNIRDLAEAIKN